MISNIRKKFDKIKFKADNILDLLKRLKLKYRKTETTNPECRIFFSNRRYTSLTRYQRQKHFKQETLGEYYI